MSDKNKVKEKQYNYIATVAAIVSSIVAIASIILSLYSYHFTQKNYFYSRVFQPLNYYYKFDMNNSEKTTCKCTTTSGCIKKLMVVSDTDNDTYTIYEMSLKKCNEQLLSDSSLEFELRFFSYITEDKKKYDYSFVYLEGTDSEWYLDCIVKEYEEGKQPQITIYEKADLLGLKRINNEAEKIILKDYEKLYNEFSRINKV